MLGAALGGRPPTAVEGDRLTVAFPPDAAFVKKKAEQGRDLVADAVRGLTGQSLDARLRAQRRASRPPPAPRRSTTTS